MLFVVVVVVVVVIVVVVVVVVLLLLLLLILNKLNILPLLVHAGSFRVSVIHRTRT